MTKIKLLLNKNNAINADNNCKQNTISDRWSLQYI